MAENMCIFCQEYKETVGHVTSSCPNVICKRCGRKGHFKMNCEHDEINDDKNFEHEKIEIDSKVSIESSKFIKVKNIKSLTEKEEEDKCKIDKIGLNEIKTFIYSWDILGTCANAILHA